MPPPYEARGYGGDTEGERESGQQVLLKPERVLTIWLLWLLLQVRTLVALPWISGFPCGGVCGKTRRIKIEALHIGMRVRHPQYGVGVVKTISEATAEIQFDEGRRTVAPEPSGLEPAEAQASIRGLEVPLAQVVQQAVEATIQRLGLEKPESVVALLGAKWHKGRAVLHPRTRPCKPRKCRWIYSSIRW